MNTDLTLMEENITFMKYAYLLRVCLFITEVQIVSLYVTLVNNNRVKWVEGTSL